MIGIDDKKIERYKTAVFASRRSFETARDHRRDLIRWYVGTYFAADGSPVKVPLNMLEMAASIWQSQLAARTPQVLVSSKLNQLQASAADFGRGMNQIIDKEMHLGDTLSDAVLEALFAPMSVCKVGQCAKGQVEIDGYFHDYGQPFCDVVDLDDFVIDLRANRMDRVTFIGDRYFENFEFVKHGRFYDNVADLQPESSDGRTDENGEERTRAMGRDNPSEDELAEDQIELLDLWLPLYNLIMTVPYNGDWTKPLRFREWEGPECGPYHILKFVKVPSQILGMSPLGMLRDLHEIANRLYAKLMKRAELSKMYLGYAGENQKDAEKIRDASDMEMLRLNSPQSLKEGMIGAPDQPTHGFVVDAVERFKMGAGNLDILGGLSAQSDTLGQDRLLNQNASRRMAAMQETVMAWSKGIIESIGFYVWYDPVREMNLSLQVEGLNRKVENKWGPEHREGDYPQYNFDIVPYSMVQHTPSQKLQEIQGLLPTLIQAQPLLQAQGKTVDMGAYIDLVGSYGDLKPELSRLIIDAQPMAEEQQPQGKPRSSPMTTRTNVRINRSGGGPGKMMDRATQMMGGRLSPQQEAASRRAG
jgi:hypothetical protein